MAGAAELLWHDPGIYTARTEESAAAWLALADVLRDRRPLGGAEDEFLVLHGRLSSFEPAVFGAVFTDPYAHFWLRLAYALVGAVLAGGSLPPEAEALAEELGTDDPQDVLAVHLTEANRMLLAGAVLACEDVALDTPFMAVLPMALPGAGISVTGVGPQTIRGVSGGEVVDFLGNPLRRRDHPVARHGDVEIAVQPHGLRVPGLGWVPAAAHTDLDEQAEHVPLIEAALALVERHQPETLAAFGEVMRWVAVNPQIGDDSFASDSRLPGSFAVLHVLQPYVIAGACIHEFHHNRLFLIEDRHPILAPDADDAVVYYSPWREEQRPLRGILHALYVTIPEFRFWLSVARDPGTDDETRLLARDRAVRVPLQFELGIRQLQRFGRFTDDGEALFAQLVADARALIDDAATLGLPDDVPATYVEQDGRIIEQRTEDGEVLTSRALIRDHTARFDVSGQLVDTVA